MPSQPSRQHSRLQRYRTHAMEFLRMAAMSKNTRLKDAYVQLAHEYQALADELEELKPPVQH